MAHEPKTSLECVLEYHELGFCMIPALYRKKKAAIRWRPYQEKRPEVADLRNWFGDGRQRNVAVVLGPVSGDLVCRDFDTIPEYEKWSDHHPDLARVLATVRTAGGYHVYILADFPHVRKIKNGELRGAGGYCLLPPSVHPSGVHYEWVIPPTRDSLIAISPEEAGFLPKSGDSAGVDHRTQDPQETQDIQAILEVREGNERGAVDLDEDERCELDTAIASTLPSGEGQRNGCIFELARWLLAIPGLCRQPMCVLKGVVRDWHTRALPFIATKGFDDTWADFIHAWNHAKWVKGDVMLKFAVKRALADEAMPPEAMEYEDERTRLLLRVCWQIDWIAGRREWFLSCRMAAEISGLGHETANKRLGMFVTDGHLSVVRKGVPGHRDATVYDYARGTAQG